ncbi:MAG: flavodoxin family protein, partial [Coriobacteriales bacterium]|nr:flavodoxin family protein [Coriobacteriales bacterium]
MKVLLINGSPHKTGCTNRALEEVASALEARGIGTEIVWLGNGPIGGCQGCGYCSSNDTCTIDDIVNDIRPKVAAADGYVFGCAVHYAGMTGNLMGFMDRLFYTASSDLAFKPAAGICSARRGGTTATFDQ